MTSNTPAENAAERAERRTLVGKVTSAKMQKTITVEVERLVQHSLYEKYLRRRTRVHAHDEQGLAQPGDTVELMSTRPLSKLKRWRLIRIVTKAAE